MKLQFDNLPFKRCIVTAAIGAAAAIGSAIASGISNKKTRQMEIEEAAKQREWSEKMYEKQNQWNIDQWNRENAYNSPSAQVERMRDAGLNPLYYGLDGNSANGLESASPLGYERAAAPNMVNPVSSGVDAATRIAQISNIQADTAKKNNENLTETQRREKMIADIATAKQELQNLLAQEGLTEAQRAEVEKRIEWADRLNDATVGEKKASAALNESQKKRIDELLEGEKNIQIKTLADFEKRWKEIEAKCKLIAEQEKLAHEDVLNYALNHSSNGFLGTGLSFQNFLRMLKEARRGDGPAGYEPQEFDGGDISTRHGQPIQ